ncbi:hypothetical protein [Methyloceanibacter sp.]|uniref:hypothetical protein n=1 Tax=Methyloceanibacter sp. TaxID=1965321 RepID=UPI003D6C7A13
MDAFAASWEVGAGCRRLSWLLHASVVEAKHAQLAHAFKAVFNPNQPRVPAGNPDGGQWAGGGGGTAAGSDAATGVIAGIQLVGGFTDDQLGLTVQGFVSGYCIGSIHRILPSQFLDSTIAEVMAAAKEGDAAARTCLKLLRQDRFRK